MAKIGRIKSVFLNDWEYDIGSDYWVATSSTAWIVKLGSDTAQSTSANAVTSTADRTYAVQLNSSDQMVVNVPWTDTTTSTASSTTAWVIKLGDDTVQSVAAETVSATANRSYALQVNASWQWVINVPWTDTTYTEVSKSDMDTGTSTTAGVVSAKSIADYVSWRVTSAVVYKGQVADYASLPANPAVWDMYNVIAKHTTAPKFDAGTNVVWNGTSWDPMAEMVDLSNLVDLTTAQTIGWVKTFSDEPVLPSKTTDATNSGTAPATEAQVYTVAQAVSTLDSWVVKTTWDQTVAWTKTFSTSPVVPAKSSSASSANTTAIATEAQVALKQDALTLPSTPTSWHMVTWWADNKTLVDGWAIPTVNDSTITVKQGGTTKKTFTTNDASNQTVNLDTTKIVTSSEYTSQYVSGDTNIWMIYEAYNS